MATPGRSEQPAGRLALDTLTFCSAALLSSTAAAAKHSAASGTAERYVHPGVGSRTRRWSKVLTIRVPQGHSRRPDHRAPSHAFCWRGSGHAAPHRCPEPSGLRVLICIGLRRDAARTRESQARPEWAGLGLEHSLEDKLGGRLESNTEAVGERVVGLPMLVAVVLRESVAAGPLARAFAVGAEDVLRPAMAVGIWHMVGRPGSGRPVRNHLEVRTLALEVGDIVVVVCPTCDADV